MGNDERKERAKLQEFWWKKKIKRGMIEKGREVKGTDGRRKKEKRKKEKEREETERGEREREKKREREREILQGLINNLASTHHNHRLL